MRCENDKKHLRHQRITRAVQAGAALCLTGFTGAIAPLPTTTTLALNPVSAIASGSQPVIAVSPIIVSPDASPRSPMKPRVPAKPIVPVKPVK